MPRRVLVGFGVDVDAVAGWYVGSKVNERKLFTEIPALGLVHTEAKTLLEISLG